MLFTQQGMRPDPKKVEAIKKAKAPTNQEILNSWICCIAWNDTFVDRFAELIRPLWDLANTKGTFKWTPEHDKNF